MTDFAIVDNCPVPSRLAPFVGALKRDTGAVLQSCYRGEDAKQLLHRHGKHTQGELYQMYLHGEGNPANPPGQSTHELRLGGAYPGPRNARAEWWQCGMDWDDGHVPALVVAAARRGWRVRQPFPGGSEYHHLNFTTEPKLSRIEKWRLELVRRRGQLRTAKASGTRSFLRRRIRALKKAIRKARRG